MIYLKDFTMLTREQDERYFGANIKSRRTCYSTQYPYIMFRDRELPRFDFTEITVFCGNNGCGKSTILNVIAERLSLKRTTAYNRSEFFDDYTSHCTHTLAKKLPEHCAIITSDDVFERVLEIRRLNDGIDDRRGELLEEYIRERGSDEPNTFTGLDDYDRWKNARDIRKRSSTSSSYLRSHVRRNIEERSNGESALAYFVDNIADGALYLLDEPENSLSPSNQLQLKYFLEDCARRHNCQFIISSHSPFLLSLAHAKIYDLETVPPSVTKWYDLECVRVYRDFFEENADSFADR